MRASYITLIINKVGDLFLILVFRQRWISSVYNYEFLLIAIAAKRALVPFRFWLPLAIKAPTPVSALVHSSTLVTAGVLLSPKFVYQEKRLFLLRVFSVLVASFCALREIDLKKVVALSTIRQIGLLGVLSSLINRRLFFVHLIIHAFLKSLLFVCVGSNIKTSTGDQMGLGIVPRSYSLRFLFSSCLGLAGLLWVSGQQSKELILTSLTKSRSLFYFLFSFSLILTLFYCLKLLSPLSQKTISSSSGKISSLALWVLGLSFGNFILFEVSFWGDFRTKVVRTRIFFLGVLVLLICRMTPKLWYLFFLFARRYSYPSSLIFFNGSKIFLSFQRFFSKLWIPSVSLSLVSFFLLGLIFLL